MYGAIIEMRAPKPSRPSTYGQSLICRPGPKRFRFLSTNDSVCTFEATYFLGSAEFVAGVNCRRKRAERGSAREAELEKDIAKAADKWNLKPLVDCADR